MRRCFTYRIGGRGVAFILMASNLIASPVVHARRGDGGPAQAGERQPATTPAGLALESRIVDWIVHRVARREGRCQRKPIPP